MSGIPHWNSPNFPLKQCLDIVRRSWNSITLILVPKGRYTEAKRWRAGGASVEIWPRFKPWLWWEIALQMPNCNKLPRPYLNLSGHFKEGVYRQQSLACGKKLMVDSKAPVQTWWADHWPRTLPAVTHSLGVRGQWVRSGAVRGGGVARREVHVWLQQAQARTWTLTAHLAPGSNRTVSQSPYSEKADNLSSHFASIIWEL